MLLFNNIQCFTNCKTLSAEASKFKTFKDLTEHFYNKTIKESTSYSKYTIQKNAKQINHILEEESKSGPLKWPNIFERITDQYPSVVDHNFTLNNILSYNLNLNSRSIVLHFRPGGCYNEYEELKREVYGVDHYEFLAIYYFIKKLIKDKKSKLFDNIFIVSQSNSLPEYFYDIFPDLKLIDDCFGDKFIVKTCVCANTIHFCGNQVHEKALYNIPVLSESFRQQYKFIDTIKNKLFLPFLYYVGWVKDDTHYPDDIDFNDKAITYKEILSKENIKRENTSIKNIYFHLYNTITELEDKLIEENICK